MMRESILRRGRFGRRRKNKRGGVIARILFGLLIIAGSLVALWLNEGRVNWADAARKSTAVDAAYNPDTEGEFVSVTGLTATSAPIGDDRYLRAGDYLRVDREVEMFAWVEKEDSDEDETSYTYELEWTDDPRPASEFNWPDGRENPPFPVTSETMTAVSARVGAYQFNTETIQYPYTDPVPLSMETVLEGPYQITEKYIFQGKGTLAQPELGDIRISFEAVPANVTMTAFGVQRESSLIPYNYRDKGELYRILTGDRAAAVARLQTEYRNLLWGFRIGGALLMWLGFGLLFSPFTRLLDFVPVVGGVGKLAVTAVSFILAFTISLTAILISAILHNLWLLLLVLAVLIIGGGWFWRQRR